MKETMSLQEICAAIIRKGAALICLALVFAILLGGWQFLSLRKKAQDPNNSPAKIEARYQTALAAYEEEKAELEKKLKKAEEKLARQEVYMEESIQMNLDPYNTARCSILVAVTDLKTDTVPTLEQTDRMVDKILQTYLRYWKLADLYTEMDARGCASAEEKYMREVMSVEITEGGTLTIKAVSDDLDEATRQAFAIYDILMTRKPQIEESTYTHEMVLLDSTTKHLIIDGIETRQTTEEKLTKTCITNVEELKAELGALKKPQKEAGYGRAQILSGSIKWAVIGGVLGVFLGAAWALCRGLLSSRLQSKRHMEAVLQVPFMGSVAGKSNIFCRMAGRLLGEPRWKDPEEAYNFVARNIGAAVDKEEKMLILTTLSEKEFAAASKDLLLAAETACEGVQCVHCADRNAQAISALAECKKVLLAERVDASDGQRVLSAMELAKRMDAAVVGFVTV